MAANYWASTQRRHWQFSRETLTEIKRQLADEDKSLVQQHPLPDGRLLSKFFNERMYSSSIALEAFTEIFQSWSGWLRRW